MEQPRPSALATSGLWAGFVKRVHAHRAYLRGKELYTERQFAEAREPLAEAVALDGDHDDARALLGWTEYALGNYRAAIVDFERVLRREPSWEGPYDGLGWSRLGLGRFVLAADAFRAALDRDPGYTDAAIGLRRGEFERSRYQAALARLTPALRELQSRKGRCLRAASVAAKDRLEPLLPGAPGRGSAGVPARPRAGAGLVRTPQWRRVDPAPPGAS